MQFIPKGGSPPQVPIYAFAKAPSNDLVNVGVAWRSRDQMTMRLDVYQNNLGRLETYTTSDGMDFLTILIPQEGFMNLGLRDDYGRYEGYDDDDRVKLVGYMTKSADNLNFKVSLSVKDISLQMAPSAYGNSMFANVSMKSIDKILSGTSVVAVVSMIMDRSQPSDMMTPFLINRISFSLGSRDDEA